MSTNIRGHKSRATHHASAKVARISLSHMGITMDEMASHLLFASMVYKREVVLYTMYVYTDFTYDQVASFFLIAPTIVRRLIMKCFYRIEKRDTATETDIHLIQSQLNNTYND